MEEMRECDQREICEIIWMFAVGLECGRLVRVSIVHTSFALQRPTQFESL